MVMVEYRVQQRYENLAMPIDIHGVAFDNGYATRRTAGDSVVVL